MAKPGDAIIVEHRDGFCHVQRVSDSGDRITVRDDITSLHIAFEIARSGLSGPDNRVWTCAEDSPDRLLPYRPGR